MSLRADGVMMFIDGLNASYLSIQLRRMGFSMCVLNAGRGLGSMRARAISFVATGGTRPLRSPKSCMRKVVVPQLPQDCVFALDPRKRPSKRFRRLEATLTRLRRSSRASGFPDSEG